MAKDSTLLLRRLLPAAFLDPFLAILNRNKAVNGRRKEIKNVNYVHIMVMDF